MSADGGVGSPVRVALMNDYEVVVSGLQKMLGPYAVALQVTPRIAVDAAAQYVDFENTTIDRATLVAGSSIRTNGALRDASAIVTSLGARVSF